MIVIPTRGVGNKESVKKLGGVVCKPYKYRQHGTILFKYSNPGGGGGEWPNNGKSQIL
jgi:hypothetical protein